MMQDPIEPGWARINRPMPHEEYKAILTALYEIAGGPKLLDLGVGEGHVTKDFDADYVDLVVRPTAPAKTIKDDIRNAPKRFARFHYNSFLMSDVIEHLTVGDALTLLEGMESVSSCTFIFTPVGPYHIQPQATDPDSHKSAWWPEVFWMKGWEVLEIPAFHRFPNGEILGAFWAWQFRDTIAPNAEEVCHRAGLSL
jgi:hypothetical protein